MDILQKLRTEGNQVAKTQKQVEKQKREHEKRKKIEKAVLKIAAEMTAKDDEQSSITSNTELKAKREKS